LIQPTGSGKVLDQLVAVRRLQDFGDLEALILPANDGGQVLVLVSVEAPRVLERPGNPRTSVGMTTSNGRMSFFDNGWHFD
jgi:hypothetical protein